MPAAATTTTLLAPVGSLGHAALGAVSYVGRLGLLAAASAAAAVRPSRRAGAPSFADEARWMLLMGLPLTALVHVGMGSFLSMQAFFGGTFVDGTGAVVGVGLIRNVAPLLVGFLLAGLFAARLTPRFEALARPPRRASRAGFLSRLEDGATATAAGAEAGEGGAAGALPAHAGAVLLAAAAVGPVLAFAASMVGVLVGWRVGQTLLGVSTDSYFQMLFEMIWPRDVVGLVLKGSLYAGLAALWAAHEGACAARRPGEAGAVVRAAAFRAACLSMASILFLNGGWFILFYLAGPAFGPTLLAPPTA